ncbi:MAG: glucose-6-phosphate isomerase [Campylobacterales bacterium]|nr:glucose-6-phosphate isomerase [Campylobacterales bacterium]
MVTFHKPTNFYETTDTNPVIEDAFAKVKLECESGEIGYYKLPQTSREVIGELKSYTQSNTTLMEAKSIVVVGIGGSSLGAKAIDSLLRHKRHNDKELIFFENSDPVDITTKLKKLNKEECAVILISKSGGTIETISTFKTIMAYLDFDFTSQDAKRLVAITDAGSILSQFASEYGIKEFNMPSNVGGRFSVLTAVGLVPLYLARYDVEALLEGAGALVESFFERKEEHLLQKAYYLYENSANMPINVLFSYSNALEDFSKWYVQLWGESLGKIDAEGKNVGFTPIGLTGSVDQHSFLQLIIEGPRDKSVTFMNIDDFEDEVSIPNISLKHLEKTDYINGNSFNTLINAQCDATMQSVIDSGVAADKISLSIASEVNIGTLIMYFELLTSITGAMLKVNTYNQPGVELGKDILVKKFQV